MTENGYVHHIKQGPGDIRDKDCPQAAAQVVFVEKGWFRGWLQNMPKADRKKKAGTENRDRISNTATSHRLGGRIGNGYGADVNADDAEHAQAAHIIDGMNKSL